MVSIEIVEEEKNKIKLKIKDETHTVLNLIRKELFNDDSVDFAGYRIEHPLVKDAIFTISTTKKDAKKILKDAIDRLQKKLSELGSEVKKM